ncbi:MAG: PIN domain-containing protein [Candidatus Lokiarchaeota archaeon]|nr:PIN domain-containing protein [Candidatus Lokiarchaeota archaeon]
MRIKMKCLDSNILIDFLRGKTEALKLLKELENESFSTTTINVFELLYGAKISEKQEDNVDEVKKLIKSFNIFSFDYKACEEASSILKILKDDGNLIDIRDAFIAGICKSNGLELITKNIKHFKNISGLKIEKY